MTRHGKTMCAVLDRTLKTPQIHPSIAGTSVLRRCVCLPESIKDAFGSGTAGLQHVRSLAKPSLMGTSFTCRAAASGQRPRARLSERADGDAATPFGDPRAPFGQSRNLAAHPWATHRRLPHFRRGKQKQLHMPSSERLIQLPSC